MRKKNLPIQRPKTIKPENRKPISLTFRRFDKKTLIIDCSINGSYEFRVFLQKHDYITYLFSTGKWSKASIVYIICYRYGFWGNQAAVQGEDIAKAYFNMWHIKNDTDVLSQLLCLQEAVMSERLEKKHKEKQREIDRVMRIFPKKRFSAKGIASRFIFFNGKENSCFCTYCRREFPMTQKLRHNTETRCPLCKKTVVAKNVNYGRKSLQTSDTGIFFNRRGNKLLMRYVHVCNDYAKDFRHPKTDVCEVSRVIFDGKDVSYFDLSKDNRFKAVSGLKDTFGLRFCSNVRTYNLKNAIKGTPYEHSEVVSALSHFDNNIFPAFRAETYLREYIKRPYLEKLVKLGLYKLANEVPSYGIEINENASELSKILCLTKDRFRVLMSFGDPDRQLLKLLQAGNRVYTKEQYLKINELAGEYYGTDLINEVLPYLPVDKVLKYIESYHFSCDRYCAYIRNVRAAGWDLKNTFIAYPKDLEEASSKVLYVLERRKRDDQITAINKRLKELRKYRFTSGGLMIMIPKDGSEYVLESNAMHNCIANSYLTPLGNGETDIVFIRHMENPEKSFYDMEIRDNKVKQVKGFCNHDPDDEVKSFVSEFEQKVLSRLKVS